MFPFGHCLPTHCSTSQITSSAASNFSCRASTIGVQQGSSNLRNFSGSIKFPTELHSVSRRQLLQQASTAGLTFGASSLASEPPSSSSVIGRDLAIQRQYDQYAGTYDELDGGSVADVIGLSSLRRSLVARAHGSVLEVGVGTGLNLPLYDRATVTSVTALDLSEGMLAQARQRALAVGMEVFVDFSQGNAEALQYQSDSFDCAVDTFSMCVFSKPQAALTELARVVKPGGLVLLLEHSRSAFQPLAWYQDTTAGAVAAMSAGCVWNQDLMALLAGAGLAPLHTESALGGLVTLVVATPQGK